MKRSQILALCAFLFFSTFAYSQVKDTVANKPVILEQEPQMPQVATNEVLLTVEQMPQFPGGTDAMNQYLHDNVIYPPQAKKDSVEGKVSVSFIVRSDGRVTDVVIQKGVRRDLDEESLRVVRNMPLWVPGKQNGIPVNVMYHLPIAFKLK